MASEECRRIADYFVVAGLPKNNPQLLDENSLEVTLRSTAHQDPITDITVIFPHLGENTPDYYQQIDATPTGLSANLNDGSFRAPEVFLCFRRGRDRAPLLDIGVLFEGKDRIDPSSQIVEFTHNGHSANVNNTNNSATYLTYKRSTEMSPCNELVVTDICVIVASKGEVPPHSFKKINKTLNKGMMGSDVYICYKQSMNRPDFVSYKPEIHSRFPLKDNPIYPLDDRVVALFCLPMGATLECWPANSARSAAVSSTFVLTLPTREKVYGSAITFYEEYHDESLTPEQKSLLQMHKYKRKSDRKIFANKCICILSQWPFFEAFENFLFFLHKRQLMGPYDIPLERFISHFLFEIPFPSVERPRILVQLSADENIALFQPEELHLPRSGASFRQLLCNLGPENCLLVLLLALTEQNILIHSLRPAALTSVAEALMQIIFPFNWQCPYIPLCPIGMSDYLAAPLPFVMGMDSRFFDLYDLPSDVNAVDLDTNTVTICTSNEGVEERKHFSSKLLPKKPARQLRNALTNLQEKCANHLRMERKLEATNDGAIDFVFKMKRKELQLEMEIREAFLRFVANILSGYSNFLMPITSAPTVGATDVKSLFDQDGFLRSKERNYHKFYEILMKTQMFTKFIEERSFASDTNTALAFFDECISKLAENFPPDNHNQHSERGLKLLELEGLDTDRTVFILPPDASDLPTGSVYNYEKFENLNPDLFEDHTEKFYANNNNVEPYSSDNTTNNMNGGNYAIFSTPSSALAKRTKHEIRSAQKSARKNRNAHPLSWAMCLMSTSYSLWYIHLPGFMLYNKSKPQSLRIGLALLQRMQRMKLSHHIDEICYRVMMQLCGVYSQPVLAVKVLFEMKRVGGIPNAVTYGYYNKAVLESVWPSGDISHGQVLWNKLRNVLLAVQMFKKLGKERNGQFLASVRLQHQMQHQLELQQKQDQESKAKCSSNQHPGSKSELDNMSRSSQDSGLSRLSSNDDQQCQKSDGAKSEHNSKSICGDFTHGSGEISNENINTGNINANGGNDSVKAKLTNENAASDNICDDKKGESSNSNSDNTKPDSTEQEEANETKNTNDEKNSESQFRRRTSTIVKASTNANKQEQGTENPTLQGSKEVCSASKQNGQEKNRNSQQKISGEREVYERNLKFPYPADDSRITTLNDLNVANLGQDKNIVDLGLEKSKEQQNQTCSQKAHSVLLPNTEDESLGVNESSSNISSHADHIRGKLSNLFGRHNSQGSGVSRALFQSEDQDSKLSDPHEVANYSRSSEPRSFVSEESSEFSGYGTRSNASKSRSQSVESDEGMVMCDPLSTDSSPNKVKPMPTLHEAMDNTSQDICFLSPTSQPGSPMHKVASSSSMCVPVTQNDPLGALSGTSSPTMAEAKSPSKLSNPSSLTKSATCPNQNLSQVAYHRSQIPEEIQSNATSRNGNLVTSGGIDENILGSPFANEQNMTRSTTMPVNEGTATNSTPGRWQLGKSRLSSLKKSSNYFSSALSTLSPSAATKVKTQDVLNSGFSKIQSAYSNATTSLSKRVEEIKEYQQQQSSQDPGLSHSGIGGGVSPAVSNQYLNAADRLKVDGDGLDRVSQTSTDSRRHSEVPLSQTPMMDPPGTWSSLTGQIWDQFWSGYTGGDGSDPNSKSNSLSNQQQSLPSSKSLFDQLEDLYSKLPKRPPGLVAMEIIITSCSRCLYCNSILYDEEIMSGWTAEDSNLNTKCGFCERMVVPFLTIRVVDFRTRSLPTMATLLTPTSSLESLSSTTSLQTASNKVECVEEVTEEIKNNTVGNVEVEICQENRSVQEEKVTQDEFTKKEKQDGTFLQPLQGKAATSSVNEGSALNSPGVNHKNIGDSPNGMADPIFSTPITVPYLSPLVLRKELENMLEREGDTCLVEPDTVDKHPIIYWNLIWYYERIAVKSHLPSLCLQANSLNGNIISKKMHNSWSKADEKNVHIRCKWDNERLHEEAGGPPPIYTQWRITESTDQKEISEAWLSKILSQQTHEDLKPHMQLIISGVQQNDLIQPIKTLLDERTKTARQSSLQDVSAESPNQSPISTSSATHPHRSIYREILFLTLVSLGQDNIDLTAFDREYRRAFEHLPARYLGMAQKSDHPPSHQVIFCRKMFRELMI